MFSAIAAVTGQGQNPNATPAQWASSQYGYGGSGGGSSAYHVCVLGGFFLTGGGGHRLYLPCMCFRGILLTGGEGREQSSLPTDSDAVDTFGHAHHPELPVLRPRNRLLTDVPYLQHI